MKTKKELEIIKKYLDNCKLMQVSTSKKNKPRIFNCWFSYDKDFNFYYISPSDAEHSKIISENPEVAFSIVSPEISKVGVGKDVQGLMLNGKASRVNGKELIPAYLNFLKKYPNVKEYIKLIGKNIKMSGTKIYKIIPEDGIWFDQINFENSPKRKLKF